MPEEKLSGLDQLISADPYSRAQFIIYIFVQQTGEGEENLPNSIERVIKGEATEENGTLASALNRALLSETRYYSREEALQALSKIKEEMESASSEGRSYVSTELRKNYLYFYPYLITTYASDLEKRRVLVGIKNYLGAEIEIYSASAYMFPGLASEAKKAFEDYLGDAEAPEGARDVEFLSWFCSQFIIDVVATSPATWYFESFSRYMSERVRPIFLNVKNQRNSIFKIEGMGKNSMSLHDLLFNEHFSCKVPEGIELNRGSVFQCFLIRNASHHELNGIIRLASAEQSSELERNFASRREAMLRLHDRFTSINGSAERTFRSVSEAEAYFSKFLEENSELIEALGPPKLIRYVPPDAEGTVTLLSERNNFYLSSLYPLISSELSSGFSSRDTLLLFQSAVESESVLPFTTLKRLMDEREQEFISALSMLSNDVMRREEAVRFITSQRGHSWDYEPLPDFLRASQ